MQILPLEFVQSQSTIAKMVAGVAIANGNGESGGAILTTLIARHPDDRPARLQLAGLRLAQNAPQTAVDILSPLKASDDPSVHALLAQAYMGLGRFDRAITSLANSTPNESTLLKRELALVQLKVGENDQAIQGLRELQQRNPGNAELAAPLIAALGRTSKWDEALAVADAMAKQTPRSPLFRSIGARFSWHAAILLRLRLSSAKHWRSITNLCPRFTIARVSQSLVAIQRTRRKIYSK
jgi:predicted Zn-dependent protease